jgi:gluconokinase
MHVLAFDIGSGGMTAVRFDENLNEIGMSERRWELKPDAAGRVVLDAKDIESTFSDLARSMQVEAPAAAISIACFMHSFVVIDPSGAALSPVFTWLDTSNSPALSNVRKRIGDEFHQHTGCQYHPMFPVFKAGAILLGSGRLIASPKSMLIGELTGEWVEDYGMASASGMFNLHSSDWDDEILSAAGIRRENLPAVLNPYAIVGKVTEAGASRLGVRKGTLVISGSGDGFLANVGSGCSSGKRIAITFGTSASARQMLAVAALDRAAGTFCYRASSDSFLLGCASSNGGNALEWAKSVFGLSATPMDLDGDAPIFLPWLNGERSLEWDPSMRASWHRLESHHTSADLLRAVMEGVIFNLAQYTEIIQRLSGVPAGQIVLSGNGFLDPAAAPLLASLLGMETLQPPSVGLASARGAAIHAWRALGHDVAGAMEHLLSDAVRFTPEPAPRLSERYEEFKRLRVRSRFKAAL